LALDNYDYEEIKTKNAVETLKSLNLTWEKVLVVVPEKNEVISKSFNNIPGVKTILANYVNPYDLLSYKKVVFLKDSLSKIEDTFLSK
jgi:large subunit ribosomal protein L4